jgi:Domain of unknown function (DUF4124)
MRLPALALLALTSLFPAIAMAQATLNKCIDAQGLVTYTNKPCTNARETHKVEIDPAPQPDRPQIEATHVPSTKPAEAPSAPKPSITLDHRVVPRIEKAANPSTKKCDTLSDKLGRTLDKMDQARRQGYTLGQMNKWDEEVRDLERKKQQSGCF